MDFTPAYYQIKTDIKDQIAQGSLRAGELLPGRKALADKYGCSYSTLNRAITELILEGVLVAEKGKGTYVATSSVLSNVSKGEGNADKNMIKVWFCSTLAAYTDMMEGMREEAHGRGKSLQIVNTLNAEDGPDHLDNYIIVTPFQHQLNDLRKAWERGERFIVLNSYFDNAPFHIMDSDIYQASLEVFRHMLENGHRKIGLLGIRQGLANYEGRVRAYHQAYREHALEPEPSWVLYMPNAVKDYRSECERWLDQHRDCTAVFSAGHSTSMSLLKLIEEKDIQVPQELSVATVTLREYASILKVPADTIVQPFYQLGKQAVARVLDGQIESKTELLPCQITWSYSGIFK